jgi:oligopeptide/dipeptide ABC transporter ATP-binding protein
MSGTTPETPLGPPPALEREGADRPAAPPAGPALPGPAGPECEVTGLTIAYRTEGSWLRAVRDVSFEVRTGETLAIVGETGSGKTSAAQAIMRLLPAAGRIESGSVRVRGTDVLALPDRRLREVRGKLIGYVPQQPSAAFNPVMTIGRQVAEALVIHEGVRYKDAVTTAKQTLAEMGLEDPDRLVRAYPHQLSGGMLQRAMIASAIIARPRLLLTDEPTSALDVSIQRQILDLLKRVRDDHGLTIVLITHDLGAVAQIADRVLVLYAGRKVEIGPAGQLLTAPRHPYTRGLLTSYPGPGLAHKSRLAALPGAPLGPAEVDAEPGCPFRTRCARVQPVCGEQFPAASGDAEHSWHCHNPEPAP